MLSIIIPTLNEEKLLPRLLESLEKQDIGEHEIIIADAGSEDRTLDIAREYGCKVVHGGIPAKGRNNGAKAASGDLLLFLDADVVFDSQLAEALQEFEYRGLDIASCCMTFDRSRANKFLCEVVYNLPIRLLENTLPHGADFHLVKRSLHMKIGGFDEEVRITEDHDYVRRAAKLGKYGLLRSIKVTTSTRRYEISGMMRVCFVYLVIELHMVFFGPIKSDIFLYRFGHYDDEKRMLTSPWANYSGWKAPFFIIWLITATLFIGLWYVIIAILFIGLNLKSAILNLLRWIRRADVERRHED